MSIIGVLGIIAAVLILILGSLKNKPLFPLCIAAIVVVALTNNINLWTAFSEYFLQGANSALASFLLLLSAATIYGEMMDKSGSTQTIVQCCLKLFGRKHSVFVILAMALILSLSGMNGMMITFALYSIICLLLKEANLPRHLAVACVLFAGNFGDGFYPLSCHVNNVLPGQFLGTKLTAGLWLGLLMGGVCLVFGAVYILIEVRRARSTGEGWTYPSGADMAMYEQVAPDKITGSPVKAFLPMVTMTVLVIVLSHIGVNSSLVAVSSMLTAAFLCGILNIGVLKKNHTKIAPLIHGCLERTVTTMAPFIFLLGVGQVISNTEGYQSIVNWIIHVDMSPYWKAAFSTATITGVMASAAGGIRLCLASLSDYFLSCGANVDLIARIITMSSTVLDTLPHCGAIFVMFKVFDLNHKTAYKHCLWMTVINTGICTVLSILLITALGL